MDWIRASQTINKIIQQGVECRDNKSEPSNQNAQSSDIIDQRYQPTSKGRLTYATTIGTQQHKDPTSTEGGTPSMITKIHDGGISKGGGDGISKGKGDNQQQYKGTTGSIVKHYKQNTFLIIDPIGNASMCRNSTA